MPEAFIYDHVRTPRGRGKPDGALHRSRPLGLPRQCCGRSRSAAVSTRILDDVVLGCVDPVGEAGGDIARSGGAGR